MGFSNYVSDNLSIWHVAGKSSFGLLNMPWLTELGRLQIQLRCNLWGLLLVFNWVRGKCPHRRDYCPRVSAAKPSLSSSSVGNVAANWSGRCIGHCICYGGKVSL